jgi:hypothetical protein
MALDRDAERVLEMVRLSGRPPYETLSTPEARERHRGGIAGGLGRAMSANTMPGPIPIDKARRKSRCGSPHHLAHSRDTSLRC